MVEIRGFGLGNDKAKVSFLSVCFVVAVGQPLKNVHWTFFFTLSFESPFIVIKIQKSSDKPMTFDLVEIRGFEPLTFALRTRRSTN